MESNDTNNSKTTIIDIQPNNTLYVNNLNEKIKLDGIII